MRYQRLLKDLERVLGGVDAEETRALVEALLAAGAIQLAGVGRSGLIMRAFAMRLTHLGLRVHVVGESTTPAFQSDHLLLVCSGSGQTPVTIAIAESALRAGGRLALITSAVIAPLARMAHLRVLLPPLLPQPDPAAAPEGISVPPDVARVVQPLRTLFEQATFLYLDTVVLLLMEVTGQRAEHLERRHQNLE
jgi:6-phospho-3-hexuloisomerase